jgi:hypothetical protein
LHGRPDGYYWPEAICDEDSLAEAFQYYIQHPDQVFYQGVNARLYAQNNLNWQKNSHFLSGWIGSTKKLKNIPNIDLMLIETVALKYDRSRNATPLQKTFQGIKSLLIYMKTRIS